MTESSRESEAVSLATRELAAHGPTREYFQLLKREAAEGQVAAAADLGEWLLEGRRNGNVTILRRSPKQAVTVLRLAASRRHHLAQLALGNCYADGVGVKKNARLAEHWFRAAARGGEHFAAFNLSTIFRDRHDSRRERYWLKRAIGLGDRIARLTLLEIDLTRGGPPADAARKALKRATSSSDKNTRDEAREILRHFGQTGHRRWV